MFVVRASLTLLLVAALTACPAADPEPLKLRVTSMAIPDGSRLDSLRVLFFQDGLRYPLDAGDAAFNFPLGDALDPMARPVVLEIAYGEQTFAAPTVRAQVTGRAAGVPRTLWEGTVDLSARAVQGVQLVYIQPVCDADQDGFTACSVQGCCPGPSPLSDCGPDDPTTHPWVREDACEPCDDTTDNDCDGQDLECIDDDGDTVADCLELECGLGNPFAAPGLVEVCDSIDNDCDGETDEDVTTVYKDATLAKGGACGTGACAGGTGVCTPDGGVACSTADLEVAGDACGDGVDNDCDGFTDEGCSLDDADGDGQTAKAGDCNDFDSAFNKDAAEPCCPDALRGAADLLERCDYDCDKAVTHCAADDLDGDGSAPPDDCDDTDPLIHPAAPERCGDGVDQDCLGGDAACATVTDADGDGWSPPADCDDTDDGVNPGAAEVCDGRDQDCDGVIDDGNPDTDGSAACEESEGECVPGTLVCVNAPGAMGLVQCVGFVPAAPEICDGLDNDCDGATDEDFPELGAVCDGADADVCAYGTLTCMPDGSGLECANESPAGLVDACDGFDNDCDGVIDQGCAAEACGALSIACPAGFACSAGACADDQGRGLLFVPAGEALMGCLAEQEKCQPDAQPQHPVKLAAFAIDRTEASCSAFCGDGGGCTGSLDDGVASWCATDGSWPVAYETWAEARAFCQARGGDLCTEAQWERAARTSLADGVYQATLRTWPWGESEPVCGVTAHFASTGAGCATGKPAAVDSYAAGASFFGLLHLAGNIEEWVLDWYAADAYVLSPLEDPSGPADGTSRVTRGGSWLRLSGQLHAFTRTPKAPGAREDKYGVRCCYPVPDPDLGL